MNVNRLPAARNGIDYKAVSRSTVCYDQELIWQSTKKYILSLSVYEM
jgi:hypothetical protein